MKEQEEKDLEKVLAILEQFGQSETSRLKIEVTDQAPGGTAKKQYHLGRCDIGSPWACGTAFDVLEDEDQEI